MVRRMRGFICEIDQRGLYGFLPEDVLPAEDVASLGRGQRPGTSVLWALLEESDAAAVRDEVWAGRPREACSHLLNRAIELLPLAAAVPILDRNPPPRDRRRDGRLKAVGATVRPIRSAAPRAVPSPPETPRRPIG